MEDAGFDDDGRIWEINLKDAIHSRQADNDSVFNGERPSAQARARPAPNERDSFTVTDSNNPLNLIRGICQHHRARHDAKIPQPVALVGMHLSASKDPSTHTHN